MNFKEEEESLLAFKVCWFTFVVKDSRHACSLFGFISGLKRHLGSYEAANSFSYYVRAYASTLLDWIDPLFIMEDRKTKAYISATTHIGSFLASKMVVSADNSSQKKPKKNKKTPTIFS